VIVEREPFLRPRRVITRPFTLVGCSLVALAALVGCADVLGLDRGIAEGDAGVDGAGNGTPSQPTNGGSRNDIAVAQPEGAMSEGGNDAAFVDDGSNPKDAGPDGPTGSAESGCPSGQKSCFSSCVGTGDPNYGCTPTGCTACSSVPNATLSCAGGACMTMCDEGYVDCAGAPCSCGAGNRCLSDDTCGPCRATLQPCQVGSDCCSGSCGAALTCL
jgi:hypothetical protein